MLVVLGQKLFLWIQYAEQTQIKENQNSSFCAVRETSCSICLKDFAEIKWKQQPRGQDKVSVVENMKSLCSVCFTIMLLWTWLLLNVNSDCIWVAYIANWIYTHALPIWLVPIVTTIPFICHFWKTLSNVLILLWSIYR